MSQISQSSRGGRRMFWSSLLCLAAVGGGLPRNATAHDLFTTCIQHTVHLAVGARHIDVTLDLTFFEEWSARERGAMDADNSGSISRSELESYLKKLAPQLSRQVKLRVAGRELPLVPLYDPEVDLLANDKTGPAHHRLRLFFFVATPAALRANDEIIVEDQLWPEAKMLGTPQVESRDGCTLEATISINPGLASARPGDGRLFKFRCLKPPSKFSVTPASASGPLTASSKPRVRSQLPESSQPQTAP